MVRNGIPTARHGFSFVDLIVAVGVVTVLVGLTVPALEAARQKAVQMGSADNLKKMVLGLHAAQDTHNCLPPAVGFFPVRSAEKLPVNPQKQQPAIHGTVFFHILPYVNQEKLWKDSKGMSHDTKAIIDMYFTQTDPSLPASHKLPDSQGAISYAANGYVLGGGTYSKDGDGWLHGMKEKGAFFAWNSLAKMAGADGAANTLAFAERFARCIAKGANGKEVDYQRAWSEDRKGHTPYAPVVWNDKLLPQFGATMKSDSNSPKGAVPCHPEAFQAFGKTINVGMFDGTVRQVSSKVSQKSWTNAMQDDDGNMLGEDF